MMSATCKEIIKQLQQQKNFENIAGMEKFGINPEQTLGVQVPVLRNMAKEIGKDHGLALELWASGIHEARILAAYIDIPEMVSEAQMEDWAGEFDSWDVCDQVCSNLFDKTTFVYAKAAAWSAREEEFVKRAGFVLMAVLAVHDKFQKDKEFVKFLKYVKKESDDGRNYVKKAINWALRQIGKRNPVLNVAALETAQAIQKKKSISAKWIATDAIQELTSAAVRNKLGLSR